MCSFRGECKGPQTPEVAQEVSGATPGGARQLPAAAGEPHPQDVVLAQSIYQHPMRINPLCSSSNVEVPMRAGPHIGLEHT